MHLAPVGAVPHAIGSRPAGKFERGLDRDDLRASAGPAASTSTARMPAPARVALDTPRRTPGRLAPPAGGRLTKQAPSRSAPQCAPSRSVTLEFRRPETGRQSNIRPGHAGSAQAYGPRHGGGDERLTSNRSSRRASHISPGEHTSRLGAGVPKTPTRALRAASECRTERSP